MTRKREDPALHRNQPLEELHSMALKAIAKEFRQIHSKQQIETLWRQGEFERHLVLLGDGTNTVFLSDLQRPVFKIALKGVEIVKETDTDVQVRVGAGVDWHQFVTWAVTQQYGGVENLALIPGSAGAAPVQNIGAYGVELSDIFEELEAFSLTRGTFDILRNEDCCFGYRNSLFKYGEPEWLICSVTLRLTKHHHSIHKSYQSLQNYFERSSIRDPGIGDIYQAVCEIRKSKLPDPRILPNCGSFFKNPVISEDHYQQLQAAYPEIPSYPVDNSKVAGASKSANKLKIPAGWLIEHAGWKGKRKGGLGMYEHHALVLVHYGGADGNDCKAFIEEVASSVQDRFGIQLEPEVHLVDG